MGRPMIPSPMNPIGPCMTSVSSQSLAGDLEAGLPRPRRDVERVDYKKRGGSRQGAGPRCPRRERYRGRAIRANVGAVRLRARSRRRLAARPARHRPLDGPPTGAVPPARRGAGRGLGGDARDGRARGRAGRPDRPPPAGPRRRGHRGPRPLSPGTVVFGPRDRAPSRRRAAGGRVRPDARPGARGRGDRPRRAARAPGGLSSRPRGLGGDRGGGAGAPAGSDGRAARGPACPTGWVPATATGRSPSSASSWRSSTGDDAPVRLSEHGVLIPFKSISGLFALRDGAIRQNGVRP